MNEQMDFIGAFPSLCGTKSTGCGIIKVPELSSLAAINDPATSLAIWQRRIPACTSDWLHGLEHAMLPHGRVLAEWGQLDRAVESFFNHRQLRTSAAAQSLAQDVILLARLFAGIAGCDAVDIRLDVIQHDACQKYHLDNVALRMVTTYMGASTHYVLPEYSKLALVEQKDYAGPIETIPQEAVAIFKGARSASSKGIVHRSPPIKGTNQTRLFLCINAPSAASPARF